MKAVVPQPTVERVVIYYRYLKKLVQHDDVKVISSLKLGKSVGVSAAIVRKDFSYFGEFGCKGVGYRVNDLIKSLEKILGFNKIWPMVLVGVGNLGRALINYREFAKMGLKIVDIFDCDLNKIGNRVGELTVKSDQEMGSIIKDKDIKMAILTVPGSEAQQVAEQMIKAGIKAIWNFAPVPLVVDDSVIIFSEDLSTGVASLVYRLNVNDSIKVNK